jgi:lipid II:glycine glycyltransferase (peptidoglycan interpeptide bridge formation enzyme)
MTSLTSQEWDHFLQGNPEAHLLQTSTWGDFKAEFGWQVERVRVGNTGAQVLFRALPLGFSFAYVPKGPVGPDWVALWPELDQVCKRRRAILLKVEPDAWEKEDDAAAETTQVQTRFTGFASGAEPIQPRRTVMINLAGGEADWLARMKQKTRYNIRLAEKKGVAVRESRDLGTFYQLMRVTGQRDGFGVHSLDYFRRAHALFEAQGMCALLMAEFEGRPLAGLMVFARGTRSWYFYGASNDEERNRMPTYLLQWEAMRWAKARGCVAYDLWGVPDADEAELEESFESRSDELWGVYRFKRGFGGMLKRSAGAWDRPYLPFVYPLYRWWSHKKHEAAG